VCFGDGSCDEGDSPASSRTAASVLTTL